MGLDVAGAVDKSGIYDQLNLFDLRKTRKDYLDVISFFKISKLKSKVKPNVLPYVDSFILQMMEMENNISVVIDDREAENKGVASRIDK